MNKILFYLTLFFLFLSFNNCSQSWQKAITKGSIQKTEFIQSIDIEVIKGIIIVPVTINGKSYRFLYDTGAPTSISKEIQKEFSFSTVSKGKIVDSDNHRQKVIYVGIDSIFLGEIPFYDQTAFVGDFTANPILACMELDGIIGSNLIRFCNWTIDYQSETLSFTNQEIAKDHSASLSHVFKTDDQYNIIVNLKIGETSITNLKIDYGSNGSLSIPPSAFSALIEKKKIDKAFTKSGYSQTGISGITTKEISEIAYLDTIQMGTMLFSPIEVSSGGKGLIGSEILSRTVISIDWSSKKLYFLSGDLGSDNLDSYGFNLGQAEDRSLYVQSIIEGSSAAEEGIVSNMKILKMGDLDFSSSSTFCDYVNYTHPGDSLLIKVMDLEGNISEHTLIKRELR